MYSVPASRQTVERQRTDRIGGRTISQIQEINTMAKKQVTVNEEMIRGIMVGDIPNYRKDISVDDVMATDESGRNECEADNPDPVPAGKSTGKQKRRKDGTDSYRKQFLTGGNIMQRQQAYIGINNYQFIQRFLSVVAPKSACRNTSMMYWPPI